MNTEEPELLEQTAEILGGGGTIDLEQLQALHAAAQDGEPVVVHFKLRATSTSVWTATSPTGFHSCPAPVAASDSRWCGSRQRPHPNLQQNYAKAIAWRYSSRPTQLGHPAEQHDFEVLHEDESIIVLNKPAGSWCIRQRSPIWHPSQRLGVALSTPKRR